MKTIQMTLDEELIADLDILIRDLGTNRSAFAREALRREWQRQMDLRKEAQHVAAYQISPMTQGEWDVAEDNLADESLGDESW